MEWIAELIGAQHAGWSLDRAFYTHPDIFALDRERVLENHWIMAGHVSQLPAPGDSFPFEMAGERIEVRRVRQGGVEARFLASDSWPGAGRPCPVALVEGLVFVSLARAEPPPLDKVAARIAPFLRLHGIVGARVAQRRIFPVNANWKLTVENYLECYHCKPAHPEYCRVEIKAEKIGDGAPAALAAFDARYREWRHAAEALKTMLDDVASPPERAGDLARAQFGAAYRAPLRATHLTASEDGRPVAPLMGAFTDYDGGETALGLGPFTFMLAYNDHAAFFQFVPIEAERSDIIVTWLVDGRAVEIRDYDPARLTWLWTVTTEQDKAIIEANAAGVGSRAYRPGPPSLLETDLVGFRRWYLHVLGAQDTGREPVMAGGRYFGF